MDDIKQSYYAIIPGFVRYDNNLSANEKLLYGELTALANKYGYCFASNKYFAELYGVTNRSITRWLANLEFCGYIRIELIKNEDIKLIERRIYIIDDTPRQNCLYPPRQKFLYPIEKNVYYNNINNNTTDNKMIDDLYILIIDKSTKIPNKFYEIIENLELTYETHWFEQMEYKNQLLIKTIIYVLYQIYNSEFEFLLTLFSRDSLINLYKICIDQSKITEIQDFAQYYKRTLINKYTNSK